MGMDIMLESEYKYRCVRLKRRKGVVGVQATQIGVNGSGSGGTGSGGSGVGGRDGGDYAAFTMLGSAASNGVKILIFFSCLW
jgi:protein-serine/threonine kinase